MGSTSLFYALFRALGRRYLSRLDVHERGILVLRPGRAETFPWAQVGPLGDASEAGDYGSLSVPLPDKRGFILLVAAEGAEAVQTVAQLLRTARPPDAPGPSKRS